MNNVIRYFFLFVGLILLQVIVGNSIHLFGVAIPFLYIYFIIRLPLSLSTNWLLTLSFLTGLTIDLFCNTPGMNALACTITGGMRKTIVSLYTPRSEDYIDEVPSIKSFGSSMYVRFLLTFVLIFCTVLFLIESLSLFNLGQLLIRIVASTILTFLLLLGMDSLTGSRREKRL